MAKTHVIHDLELLIIGGSAGSLGIIIDILQHLKSARFAVVVIIHRKGGADSVLTDLLAFKTDLTVKEIEEKDKIIAGTVYLAPADYHLLFEGNKTISLDASEKVNFSRPSIDVAFESAAGVYKNKLAGLLLSGGNNDGAEGLHVIHKLGGLTIVQDPETADVPYMPASALNIFTPHYIIAKQDIPAFISNM